MEVEQSGGTQSWFTIDEELFSVTHLSTRTFSTRAMSERRRAEIAEKRARLAALKQARQDREQSTRQQLQLSSSSSTPPIGSTSEGDDSRPNSRIGGGLNKADEIENLLRGVGVRTSSPRVSQGPPVDVEVPLEPSVTDSGERATAAAAESNHVVT